MIDASENYGRCHTDSGICPKACQTIPLDEDPQPQMVTQWLAINDILTLNVAEPRESKCPQGIYLRSISFLRSMLIVCKK
jgi:hypothetical protein